MRYLLPVSILLLAGYSALSAPASALPSATQSAPDSDWRDWPLTPGNWRYQPEAEGGLAFYGRPGATPDFTLRCLRARGEVLLSRTNGSGNTMTVLTSSLTRRLTAAAGTAALASRDALLDAMGFSRGHFVIWTEGMPTLVLPAWPEVLRVVEDCR